MLVSVNKLAILSAPSYNTSEEDVIIYQVENESGSNQLSIGAGTGSLNAMTALSFRTASAVNTLGGGERLRIQSYKVMASVDIKPNANGTLDLGASGTRWRNIYTSDIDLSNELKKDEGGNEVDGTWGAYTIQEGENDLFLINRRSGKRYKFNLTEVS